MTPDYDQIRQDSNHSFFITYNSIIDEKMAEIGVHAFAVYSILLRMSGKQNSAWPSQTQIAKTAGIARTTVIKSIDTLIAHGLLTVEKRFDPTGRPTSNLYTVKNRYRYVRETDTYCTGDGHPTVQETDTKNTHKEEDNTPIPPRGKSVFKKPSVEDVRAYVEEKGYHFDAEAFCSHYESKGWRVGNSPMKSWQAACVTWEKNWEARNPAKAGGFASEYYRQVYEKYKDHGALIWIDKSCCIAKHRANGDRYRASRDVSGEDTLEMEFAGGAE